MTEPSTSSAKETSEQRDIPRELFEMVYQWGRVGIVTDEHCPAFKDTLEQLLAPLKAENTALSTSIHQAEQEMRQKLAEEFNYFSVRKGEDVLFEYSDF